MKITIKKSIEIDGGWFKVIDENDRIKHFSFDPYKPEDAYDSERNALSKAMAWAKMLEDNEHVKDVIVYETPSEEKQTAGIDLSKIDEI